MPDDGVVDAEASESTQAEAEAEVDVLEIAEVLFVESPGRLECGPPVERRRGTRREHLHIARRPFARAHPVTIAPGAARGVIAVARAVEEIRLCVEQHPAREGSDVGLAFGRRDECGQPAGRRKCVRVEERERVHFAGGLRRDVVGASKSRILLKPDDLDALQAVTGQQQRVVGAVVIDQNHAIGRAGLRAQRPQAFTKEFAAVPVDDEDGNRHATLLPWTFRPVSRISKIRSRTTIEPSAQVRSARCRCAGSIGSPLNTTSSTRRRSRTSSRSSILPTTGRRGMNPRWSRQSR